LSRFLYCTVADSKSLLMNMRSPRIIVAASFIFPTRSRVLHVSSHSVRLCLRKCTLARLSMLCSCTVNSMAML
jgi:hypothetical protein